MSQPTQEALRVAKAIADKFPGAKAYTFTMAEIIDRETENILAELRAARMDTKEEQSPH